MESTVRVRVLRKGENSLYLEIEGENSRNRPQFRLLELQIAGERELSEQSRKECVRPPACSYLWMVDLWVRWSAG